MKKKFVNFSKLEQLKKTELKKVKGGRDFPCYGIPPIEDPNPFPLA